MAKLTYAEKLRDPRWQRRRLEIMQRADFRCERCDGDKKTLNVHHKRYRRGADPWDYSDDELACLCEDCHELEHGLRERLDALLTDDDCCSIETVIGFIEGNILFVAVDDEARLRILGAEHADGVACAFLIHPSDVFDVLDDKGAVTRGALMSIRRNKYGWKGMLNA